MFLNHSDVTNFVLTCVKQYTSIIPQVRINSRDTISVDFELYHIFINYEHGNFFTTYTDAELCKEVRFCGSLGQCISVHSCFLRVL